MVALVGDVVLASRPCWHHVTREGSFGQAATLALRLILKSLGWEITNILKTYTLNVVADIVRFTYNLCRTDGCCCCCWESENSHC